MTGYYGPAYHRPDLVAALDRAERYKATILTVVCPNDHVLVRVQATTMGRMLVWIANDLVVDESTDAPEDGFTLTRAPRAVRWVAELVAATPTAKAACRCREGYVPGRAIDAALAAGRRRVVAEPTSVRGLFSIDGVSDGTADGAR